jgi:hypothetical protein
MVRPILLFALIAGLALQDKPPLVQPAGELEIYDMATQIGTRARRTFRDAGGRIVKEIYYTGPFSGPAREDQLTVQSSRLYHFRPDGRLDRREIRGPKDELRQIQHHQYDAGGALVLDWFEGPTGIREMETRHAGNRRTLYEFDPTGSRVISARGAIRSDRDLTDGWGPDVGGLSIGIALPVVEGAASDIAAWLNLRNATAQRVHFRGPDPMLVLTNARGERIPERPHAARANDGQSRPIDFPIRAGYSELWWPPYSMTNRFGTLAPGRYTLRLTMATISPGLTLESNTGTFVIK